MDRKKSDIKWLLVPVGIMSLLIIAIMVLFPSIRASVLSSSTQTTQSNAVVRITDWTSRLSDGETFYYVEGVVKNTGNATAYAVKVTVKGYDVNQHIKVLEWDMTEPSMLAPQQEGIFEILLDVVPGMKTIEAEVECRK